MFMPSQAVMLLVGDQTETAEAIAKSFSSEEVEVRRTETGGQALTLAAEAHPAVIITETALPDMRATELVRSLREWSTSSIIAVSSDASIETKAEFLESGADDYMVKPLGFDEFKARLRVAFRHRRRQHADFGPIYRMGGTTVNLATRKVDKNGEAIALTPLEFQILAELIKGAGRIVTREHLTRKMWARTTITELQTLRVYIGTLRQKLGRYPDGDILIETVSGVGYRLFHSWAHED